SFPRAAQQAFLGDPLVSIEIGTQSRTATILGEWVSLGQSVPGAVTQRPETHRAPSFLRTLRKGWETSNQIHRASSAVFSSANSQIKEPPLERDAHSKNRSVVI